MEEQCKLKKLVSPAVLLFFPIILIKFSIRTTKRPVPLEHCLFYSGELFKVCEREIFLPQGLKAAKDASRKKHLTAGVSSGPKPGTSAGHDNARVQKTRKYISNEAAWN